MRLIPAGHFDVVHQVGTEPVQVTERRGKEEMRRAKKRHPFPQTACRQVVAVLILASMFLAVGCKDEIVGPEGSVGIGELAIDFGLPNQFGGTTTMSDYRGQVILLTLSALWCVPCREQASDAEALYQRLVGEGFITLEVLVDDETIGGDRATVEDAFEWAEEYGITFPVMADTQGTVDQIYGMGALPVSVVIDRGFVVRNVFLGYDEEEIVAAIEALL